MTTLLEEVISELRPFYPAPERTLNALRVPPACHELEAFATGCEPALTRLCDYYDSNILVDARDVIRGLLRLTSSNGDLSKKDYQSIDAIPDGIDTAYRALPLRQMTEPWWRETLREALVARLLLSPDEKSVEILATALRTELPIDLALPTPQNSPFVRLSLLQNCLKTKGHKHSRLLQALADTTRHLDGLPELRKEALHPENAAILKAMQSAHTRPALTVLPREDLARLVRDIGNVALAQRREYHAPAAQRVPAHEILHELLHRARKWKKDEQVALQTALLFGRLGTYLLNANNEDPYRLIQRDSHEVWIRRRLPDAPEFTRQLGGPGYADVGREFHIPLPRRISQSLADLLIREQGIAALRGLKRKLREMSRDSGQLITLRRLTRVFEYSLENETPDEALTTLLGLQAQARRDAGIHYFSPASAVLTERLQSVIEQTAMTFNLDALDDGWSVPPPNVTPYLGYSYRADIDAVRALIASLNSRAELERGRVHPQRVIETYNIRVALLTLMYLAGTGARPTGNVLPSHEEVSVVDRAAIASEKDALGYRSTRLVPLSTRFITEIADFEKWARAKRLLPHNPPPDAPLALLRTPEGAYVEPTITACKRYVVGFSEHWVWPDDMLRHLFRSHLWEMNCPSSWLRRTMGHHPPHDAADMPWCAQPQWEGLHTWTDVIDEHLETLGF